MLPPSAKDSQGRYPPALLNDPESAEEVREALAIARAEASALQDEVVRLTLENGRLAAAQPVSHLHSSTHHASGTIDHALRLWERVSNDTPPPFEPLMQALQAVADALRTLQTDLRRLTQHKDTL